MSPSSGDLYLKPRGSLKAKEIWFEVRTGQTVEVTYIERVVRQANEEDLDAVLRVDQLAPIGHDRGPLLTLRLKSGDCLVYEYRSHILGYAVVTSRSFFERDFIELLAVAPDGRRAGVASALLRRAVSQSATPDIFTSTNQSNVPMLNLLNREGWKYSGQIEGIDDGDPELVFYTRSE